MLTDAAAKVKPRQDFISYACEQIQTLHVHVILIPSYDFQAAYDKACAAKKQAEERDRQLDDRRKKFKIGELLLWRWFIYHFINA